MGGITKFIDTRGRNYDEIKVESFTTLIKNKSEKEIRKIEQSFLKPKPIAKYVGPKSGQSSFVKRTISITFPDTKHITKLGKFIRVNTYIKNNTYDVDMLIELIKLMETGRLHWNKTLKRFFFKERVGRRIKL